MPIIADDTNYESPAGWQFELIENLIASSSFDHSQREMLMIRLNQANAEQANDMISLLYLNQLDPITAGLPYSANDIKRHLKKLR